jgi:hypothetical protein
MAHGSHDGPGLRPKYALKYRALAQTVDMGPYTAEARNVRGPKRFDWFFFPPVVRVYSLELSLSCISLVFLLYSPIQ